MVVVLALHVHQANLAIQKLQTSINKNAIFIRI